MRIPSVCVLVLALPWPGTLSGQAVTIPDEASCRSCAIEMSVVQTLGDVDGAGAISQRPTAVRKDSRGNLWVLTGRDVPMVFSPDSRHVMNIGRKGAGPGEYRNAFEAVAIPGDSMLVLDAAAQRVSVIGPDRNVQREIVLPGSMSAVLPLAWPGLVVTNSLLASPDHIGWPLQMSSLERGDMAVLGAFGLNRGEYRPGDFHTFRHALAKSPSGTVWSAGTTKYELAEWKDSGELLRHFIRQSRWFPNEPYRGIGSPSGPPSPTVKALVVDSTGLLWVFYYVPADDWTRAWSRVPIGSREAPMSAIDSEKLYDTVVEVIDPSSRRVVVRRKIAGAIINAFDDGHVALYSESAAGTPVVNIARLRLRRD